MSDPTDPHVSTAALAAATGVPAFQMRLWLRAAGMTRPAPGRRGVGLLSALTGILTALRDETATARSFRPAPIPKPGDRLDEQVAALTADLLRLAEGRAGGPVAEEVARIIDRLAGHRRTAMKGCKA
ncbi:hypothetical protein G5B31_20650 [Rhodobacter sp. SGA-6-6]|uniref:hypothetical protein n=1 Tax=Rhodobacter sp. SGA-6-6 TaxID=2710882 RepID=UPI0013EB84F0|nr:hypothetical protein [Rhodobacter sp. SGA-6-6]NGM47931.1 hypothetical protein [Rhodobacter sp. SGA-6-6]